MENIFSVHVKSCKSFQLYYTKMFRYRATISAIKTYLMIIKFVLLFNMNVFVE